MDQEGVTMDFSITTSLMMEYVFCPRFTYFEYVLDIPQNEGRRFKVEKGRTVHENVRTMNPDYLRKKIGVTDKKIDVYLSGQGIRGVVDEILFLSDGMAAPLDYKYAEYKERVFKTYKLQLVFYGRLIRENYNVPVNRGFIVYTRSKNKLIEIPLTEKDFDELNRTIHGISDVIIHCRFPGPTTVKKRCPDCCYRNLCSGSQ